MKEQAIQSALLTSLLAIIGLSAAAIVLVRMVKKILSPLLHRAEQEVTNWEKTRIDRYNNLPDLGKARSDKNVAKMAKYGGTAAAVIGGGALVIATGVTGVWVIPLVLGSRWVWNNWKEQSNATKEADKRREQILHS